MKSLNIFETVLILLFTGLLLTSLTSIVNRYFPMPDVVHGFLMRLGLTIEVIALIKMERNKKKE
ncbi:MAG TPA: hypothetical protein VF679_11755 [Pedobacter sp.]